MASTGSTADPWTEAWPDGYGFFEAPVLPSTSDTARERAEAGEAGPLWIRADRQSAGRGRRGRPWTSPSGNLFATLLLRPACSASIAAQLSYVTALAVADVVSLALPGAPVGLKWPNDVRVAGAKIAGILLESGGSGRGPDPAPAPARAQAARSDLPPPDLRPRDPRPWLAIGVGLNIATHPGDAGYPTTSLSSAGAVPLPSVGAAMAALARRMDHWLTLWDAGTGFGGIRAAWLDRAEGLGGPLEARLPKGSVRGRFTGLDEAGGLILSLADGSDRIIHGGEVFFPDADAEAVPAPDR
ncbi:MAG: biotin--[acetyl-CoA-carboxylase] ligase [Alphaproteobacteria bacterium]